MATLTLCVQNVHLSTSSTCTQLVGVGEGVRVDCEGECVGVHEGDG